MENSKLDELLRKLDVLLEIRNSLLKMFEGYDEDSRYERYQIANEILSEAEQHVLMGLYKVKKNKEN
jgi:hypothetical protein